MFLRQKIRRKDGKEHRTFSVVDNKRVAGDRVVQRHVLYLGEINDSQELAWRKSIEVIGAGSAPPRTLSLFPEDGCEGLVEDGSIVRLRLSQMRLTRPRQWGACWLTLTLWRELKLDRFWAERLAASRKGTRWDHVLLVLVAYRLLAPGSEWRLHREWFEKSALADLLGEDFAVAEIHKLYASHGRLSEAEVRRYLLHLRDQRGVARGTFTPPHGGIRFLFAHTLDREWSLFSKKESVRPSASGCPMCRRTPRLAPSSVA